MSKYFYLSGLIYSIFLPLLFFAIPLHAENKLVVLSSIRPLALIVEEIAGDFVSNQVLLENADSPHHLALRVSQIEKLKNADLVVWVGPDFERFLEKPLGNRRPQIALSRILIGTDETHDHLSESHEDHRERHLWLNPDNIRTLAAALEQQLKILVPEHRNEIANNKIAFLNRFNALDKQTRSELSRFKGGFIVYHPALDEYVSAYKLNQVASVVEGSDQSPGLRKIVQLKTDARSAKCLIADIQEFEAAERYADLLNLPLQKIDVLAVDIGNADWFDYFAGLAKVLTQCYAANQ